MSTEINSNPPGSKARWDVANSTYKNPAAYVYGV
jgi:hypothetical protein